MKKYLTFGLNICVLFFFACSTDDTQTVNPESGAQLSISANQLSIPENGGSTEVIFTLSESSQSAVTADLVFSGTAISNGVDFISSSSSIDIPSGSLTATITITTIDDTLEEGNEIIDIALMSLTGANAEGNGTIRITIEDDDVPFQAQIILNEILYDPSNNGLEGDANGDGSYAQNEDEFLEFLNLSSQEIDLAGYKIYDTEGLDANSPKHIFPPNSLVAPGKAIVVFGGGTPTGSFGGAVVQTSTSGDMNLNNAGDVMTLEDAEGNVVLTFDIEPLSNNPNESYTRNPDITGEFEQHGDNTPILFSPGTKIDGSSF